MSYSKCNSSKYMSYATLFYNKNYLKFKDWIIKYINSRNRWDIILVANSKINKNISWAYKFYPLPDNAVEIWDEFKISILSSLSNDAKKDNLIFFISAGPTANIIISYLIKINNRNIYSILFKVLIYYFYLIINSCFYDFSKRNIIKFSKVQIVYVIVLILVQQ